MNQSTPSRPCWVEISTRSIENNYRFLRTVAPPGAELLAVVKADAYGHSLALCAPAAVRAGARWLGVTTVEEGVAARAVCPSARILVMGGVFPGQGPNVVDAGLTPVVWEPAQLDEIEQAAGQAGAAERSVAVHLEVDSGMSRQGAMLGGFEPLAPRFGAKSRAFVEAVTTHLYASDETNGVSTASQVRCLGQALTEIEKAQPPFAARPEWLSVGASAALLGRDVEAVASLAREHGLKLMLRPGLALYGLVPRYEPPYSRDGEPSHLAEAERALEPALAWKTRVVSLRNIPAGAEIGYNGTFVATEPMRLALIAAGYADGLDRHLGNHFSLLVRGQRAPLVGRISMDQAVLDVTEIPGVEAGDEVVILGRQGVEVISAFDHADATDTIPWEVFTRIAPRVRRVAAN